MNLNEDATLSECLLYYIKEGVTKVGSPDSNQLQDIQLVGAHIQSEHCHFENSSGVVKLIPKSGAICFVNGKKIEVPITLRTGSRVILGKNHVFRFNHPEQARELSAQGTESFKMIYVGAKRLEASRRVYRTRANRPPAVYSLNQFLGPDFELSNCKNA